MAKIWGHMACQELGINPVALLEFQLRRNKNSPKPDEAASTKIYPRPTLPSAMYSMLSQATPTTFPQCLWRETWPGKRRRRRRQLPPRTSLWRQMEDRSRLRQLFRLEA